MSNIRLVDRRRDVVRDAMAVRGITMTALAQLTGIAYSRLDNVLQGRIKNVLEEEVGHIARVLDLRAPEVRDAIGEAVLAFCARQAGAR